MLAVRAVGLTVFTIEGNGLEPVLKTGDRVLVNRWSYGLRVGAGEGGVFGYGRLWRQPVGRGELVAFEHPQTGEVMVCRCEGLPGDTINMDGRKLTIPSLKGCADADYYWMEAVGSANPLDSHQIGFVSEERIIGRVFMVAYNHAPHTPFWQLSRLFMPL